MSIIDVKVECGNAYRYLPHQFVGDNKKAMHLKVGEILPDLRLPGVIPPCACKVTKIVVK